MTGFMGKSGSGYLTGSWLRVKAVSSVLLVFLILFAGGGCGNNGSAVIGSSHRPVTMYFVPSGEAGKVLSSGKEVGKMLMKKTGMKIKTAVPTSYAAVIEAMGAGNADVAWLPTFAYVLAHRKYNVQVALTTVRYGRTEYRGEILVRADSGIRKLTDLNGKCIAYTDAASTAGHVFPKALFARNGIKPGREFFAGGHPQAVMAVYEGMADAGCAFWSPVLPDGSVGDARKLLLESEPDVIRKVIPIAFTDWIPNDTVSFRKDFPDSLRKVITDALVEIAESEEGRSVLEELYGITGLVRADPNVYEKVPEQLSLAGVSPEELLSE